MHVKVTYSWITKSHYVNRWSQVCFVFHVWEEFYISSNWHHQQPAVQLQVFSIHWPPQSLSVLTSPSDGEDHLDVCTDHTQRSLIMIKTISTERQRRKVSLRPRLPPSTFPCFMASITQCDGISMNNAVVPCPGLEYGVRLYVHTDMKERGQRFLWMIKAQLK